MKTNEEIVIRGDWTALEICKEDNKYYIYAFGDGVARLEISKTTYEHIKKDYEWGVDECYEKEQNNI